MTPETPTRQQLRDLIARHGGSFHGPQVEHLSMEEDAFWRFMDEAMKLARETDAAPKARKARARKASPKPEVRPLDVPPAPIPMPLVQEATAADRFGFWR